MLQKIDIDDFLFASYLVVTLAMICLTVSIHTTGISNWMEQFSTIMARVACKSTLLLQVAQGLLEEVSRSSYNIKVSRHSMLLTLVVLGKQIIGVEFVLPFYNCLTCYSVNIHFQRRTNITILYFCLYVSDTDGSILLQLPTITMSVDKPLHTSNNN